MAERIDAEELSDMADRAATRTVSAAEYGGYGSHKEAYADGFEAGYRTCEATADVLAELNELPAEPEPEQPQQPLPDPSVDQLIIVYRASAGWAPDGVGVQGEVMAWNADTGEYESGRWSLTPHRIMDWAPGAVVPKHEQVMDPPAGLPAGANLQVFAWVEPRQGGVRHEKAGVMAYVHREAAWPVSAELWPGEWGSAMPLEHMRAWRLV